MEKPPQPQTAAPLIEDVRKMIDEARNRMASAVNSALAILYWRIGRRIDQDLLSGERADYGKEIVATLSQQLTQDYGSGSANRH